MTKQHRRNGPSLEAAEDIMPRIIDARGTECDANFPLAPQCTRRAITHTHGARIYYVVQPKYAGLVPWGAEAGPRWNGNLTYVGPGGGYGVHIMRATPQFSATCTSVAAGAVQAECTCTYTRLTHVHPVSAVSSRAKKNAAGHSRLPA